MSCRYYDKHPFGDQLVEFPGAPSNRCGYVTTSHSPCGMELAGNAPDEERCPLLHGLQILAEPVPGGMAVTIGVPMPPPFSALVFRRLPFFLLGLCLGDAVSTVLHLIAPVWVNAAFSWACAGGAFTLCVLQVRQAKQVERELKATKAKARQQAAAQPPRAPDQRDWLQ